MDAVTRQTKARRLRTVRDELSEATRRRTELWHEHEGMSDATFAREVDRLSRRIDSLWNEARVLTAEIRNGARADIIARARQTERIERDLRRPKRAEPAEALAR